MSDHNESLRLEQELKTLEMRRGLEKHARHLALRSMVKEILARDGITDAEFQHHFRLRKNHYHDKHLRGLEDTMPCSAAALDDRELDDIPESSDFPPLFP